jgi:prevent-host-death family protein
MAITIGIRELRQHASRYLRRVREGETITVTDRGETVAKISGPDEPENVLDRLASEGRIIRAKRNWRDLPPPVDLEPEAPLPSEVLRDLREHER